jgi:NAD(P)-dependent dehydrogenase (short-subunit alcohol dehydrogenase family)
MKKTVLVTGITGTIGKATALEFAKNKQHVILLCRNDQKGKAVQEELKKQSGNPDIDLVIADLAEPDSVKAAVALIKQKYPQLDAIVNVAAVFKKNRAENSKGLETTFATNHLGPFALSNGLIDLIKQSKGKVITVSAPSTTKVNFDDLQSKQKYNAGFTGIFGASKMMNLMYTYSLARKLEGSGASAMAFHPGLVKSDITKDMGFLGMLVRPFSGPPDKAAAMLYKLATEDKFQNGKFYKFTGAEIKSSDYSYSPEFQDKLWKVSEELLSA